MARLGHQRLAALFGAGLLFLNFPLLALWDHDLLVAGIPLFPAALLAIWAVLIAALGLLTDSMPD
jgi:hypothetical protein